MPVREKTGILKTTEAKRAVPNGCKLKNVDLVCLVAPSAPLAPDAVNRLGVAAANDELVSALSISFASQFECGGGSVTLESFPKASLMYCCTNGSNCEAVLPIKLLSRANLVSGPASTLTTWVERRAVRACERRRSAISHDTPPARDFACLLVGPSAPAPGAGEAPRLGAGRFKLTRALIASFEIAGPRGMVWGYADRAATLYTSAFFACGGPLTGREGSFVLKYFLLP